MDNDPVVIVGAARTPMAGLQGDFASLVASDRDCTSPPSLSRALDVNNDDTLAWEIAPVTVPGRKGGGAVTHDS